MAKLSFFELVGFVIKGAGAVIVATILVILAIFLLSLVIALFKAVFVVAKERHEKSLRGEKQNKFVDDLVEYLDR